MPSNDNYHQQQRYTERVASRRRLPFDSISGRMSASLALKRPIFSTFHYPSSNYHHEIFLNKSSSSSITENEDDTDVKILDETIPEMEQHKKTTTNNRHLSMNNKKDIGDPMIQELLQSNMNLKKEIRDIRHQIKHNNESNKQRVDRTITTTSASNKIKDIEENDDGCSFAPPGHAFDDGDDDDDPSTTISKLQHYKKEAALYKQQLETCHETINHLRKTIHSLEKRTEQLRTTEQRQAINPSNQYENLVPTANNNTDHRFIHELFHLCIKYTPRSSKSKTTVPSHHDMKTFIRRAFTDLIQTTSSKRSANRTYDIGHYICKCSERSQPDHRPSYQYCLTLIEQCQSLFDVTCYTQLSTALNELYYRHGELANFKRSVASTLGVTESSRLVSCPKLIRTLQQTLDDAKSNELVTFKKLAKINDMNEAVSKIRSYDDFVPYYHQFIEQMANLLEVSKGDEIMPAIKTLKLLAHNDTYIPSHHSQPTYSLTRATSLNTHKDSYEKNLSYSKSLRILSSRLNIDLPKENNSENQTNDNSEQKQETDSQ